MQEAAGMLGTVSWFKRKTIQPETVAEAAELHALPKAAVAEFK